AQVLDDRGQPISEAEIRAHQRSGANGGVVGGILGAGLGLFIGLGAPTSGEDLEGGGDAAPLIGAALGAGAGAFLGVRLTRVTRQKAIERIRRERRLQTSGS